MRSTFTGFESIRTALMASQIGQDVVSQNIANINTKGYTRQRVDLAPISTDTGTNRYAVPKSNFQGLGVEVSSITQVRDMFLDIRCREQNSITGKLDGQLAVLQDVENILDEVSTDGLNQRLGDLFTQLQEFSQHPEAVEFATVFRSAAAKVVQVLNQYDNQLESARSQEMYELNSTVDELNSIVSRIAKCNSEIRNSKIQGYTANELMDERNLLLDNISAFTNVEIINNNDAGVSLKIGDRYLLDGEQSDTISKLVVTDTNNNANITWDDGARAEITGGKIAGYLEGLNGCGIFASSQQSEYNTNGLKYFQISLDQFAKKFADTFNKINDPAYVNKLFTGRGNNAITAGNIQISDKWQKDAQFAKASSIDSVNDGRNDNILAMINAMNQETQITPFFKGTLEEFATSLMDDMAVEVSFISDLQNTAQILSESIQGQRDSVSGVSLDEEGMNIVKYQKSYAAAARVMTAMDEMLEILINQLGLVGR